MDLTLNFLILLEVQFEGSTETNASYLAMTAMQKQGKAPLSNGKFLSLNSDETKIFSGHPPMAPGFRLHRRGRVVSRLLLQPDTLCSGESQLQLQARVLYK